jgi:hypothetical protein
MLKRLLNILSHPATYSVLLALLLAVSLYNSYRISEVEAAVYRIDIPYQPAPDLSTIEKLLDRIESNTTRW